MDDSIKKPQEMPNPNTIVEDSISEITGLTREAADAAMYTMVKKIDQTKTPQEYLEWLKDHVKNDADALSVVCGMYITLLVLGALGQGSMKPGN